MRGGGLRLNSKCKGDVGLGQRSNGPLVERNTASGALSGQQQREHVTVAEVVVKVPEPRLGQPACAASSSAGCGRGDEC